MRARRTLILLAVVAPMLTAGCRDVARKLFKQPVVSLRDVRVRSVGFAGTSLDVYLAIVNPNPYPLKATGASYHLIAGDSLDVGSGATSDTASVAAHDSTIVKLPIDVQWQTLGVAGVQALTAGRVDYRVTGSITIATPVGGYGVPIDTRGRVQVRRGS